MNMKDCIDFWKHYSCVNEMVQEDLRDEVYEWLEWMSKQKTYELFGYYWSEEDPVDGYYDGVYFGDPKDVLDGDELLPLYQEKR